MIISTISSLYNCIAQYIKYFLRPSTQLDQKINGFCQKALRTISKSSSKDLKILVTDAHNLTEEYKAKIGFLESIFYKKSIQIAVDSLVELEKAIQLKSEIVITSPQEPVSKVPKPAPKPAALKREKAVHFKKDENKDKPVKEEKTSAYRIDLDKGADLSCTEEATKNLITSMEEDLVEADLNISKDFFYEDSWLGRDVVQCIGVVKWMIELMENREKELAPQGFKKLLPQPSFKKNTQALNNAKAKIDSDKERRPTKTNWFDSRYFRDLLASHPDMPFEEVIKLYSPGPINFRFQSVATPKGVHEWFRIGVITDLTNGWTNLKELLELQKDETKLEEKIHELQLAKEKYKNEKRIVESIDYCLKEVLGQDGPAIAKEISNLHCSKLSKKKKSHEIKAYERSIAKLLNKPAVKDALKATIEKRRMILKDQMNILCISQLMTRKEELTKLAEGGAFTFVHVGLLNELTQTPDPTGWVHYENNEMLDMYQIFKEYQGRTVFFDEGLKKPYIDGKGQIHMPKIKDGPSQIVLNPIFFNTSVQGNTENTPIQRAINEEAKAQLCKAIKMTTSVIDKFLKKAFKGLAGNKSNYDIATYLCLGIMEYNIALSFGCLSAKDRTGFVGEFLARWYIKDVLSSLSDRSFFDKIKKEMFVKKLNNGVLEPDSNAAQVIGQCTGAKVIKSTAPLITSKVNPVNPFKRMKYYFNQLLIDESVK